MTRAYPCGPLAVVVDADEIAPLVDRARELLEVYATSFSEPPLRIFVRLLAAEGEGASQPSEAGEFLDCARMRVTRTPSGLAASCLSGAWAVYRVAERAWQVSVPLLAERALDDLDDLLGLILTQGWRAAGWTPLHAAAVARGGVSTLVCAPSGGGKSTLAAALVRRGWSTLGDDKLLLRVGADRTPEIAALTASFNLDPGLARWFPELALLERLPAHSVWTEKRRVATAELWPGRLLARARPTSIVRLARRQGSSGIRVRRLAPSEVLSLLLHQTVVPRDRAEAQRILATIALTAERLGGLEAELGDGVYADPRGLEPLEVALGHVA